MSQPGRFAWFAAACVLAAYAVAEPISEEDVVRMFVAGSSVEQMLEAIAVREPGFNLTRDLLDELRHVHLPEPVIEAMLRRQKQWEPAAAASPGEPSYPQLRLQMDRQDRGRTVVSIRAKVDPQLAAELELGNAPEDREFADVALLLACTTADHVPDQWRLHSPIGRDFDFALRHKILVFLQGVRGEGESGDEGRRVKVAVPTTIEVPLEPFVAHDLVLGIAVQIGGRYRVIATDRRRGAVLDQSGLDLPAWVKGRSVRTFKARFVRGDDDEGGDEDEDADENGQRN